MAMRPALAAFRRLMRARELAFKGDTEMLTQSRLAVRAEFLKHKVSFALLVCCLLGVCGRLQSTHPHISLGPQGLDAACIESHASRVVHVS